MNRFWERIQRKKYKKQRREVGRNGWRCHVCGDYRPDAMISVHSTTTIFSGVPMQQNVRYCNDRPECIEGAKHIRWIKEEENGRA